MSSTFCGIDPSLSGTAVAVVCGDKHETLVFGSPPAAGLHDRMGRYMQLVGNVLGVLRTWPPARICIEGYSFGSRGGQALDRVEYGGILRLELLKLGVSVVEVPPLTLKLFATGKGNADKPRVALGVFKLYGQEFRTDDETDAFALAKFAECLADPAARRNEAQRRAVESILNPKKKKERKKGLGAEG